jgi:PIN domain nuclease of toxin-antitoxin system
MDLADGSEGAGLFSPEDALILLDTNALIWLLANHKRVRKIPARARLYVSPASLLELRFLEEIGRIRFTTTADAVEDDDRFAVDDPSAKALFGSASLVAWTRDPFDRLIVGHAQLRGWRLATADSTIIKNLPPAALLAL